MRTQVLPAQTRTGMLGRKGLVMPSGFLPVSDRAIKVVTEARIDRLAARLERHPFLAGMNRRQLALLSECAMTVQFEKGEVIFREGDLADRLYLIETGKVGLESSSTLGDPRSGWSWMFPPYTRTCTARAVEPVTAIFFHSAFLREYCERDHSFGYELLKRMSFVMCQRRNAARTKILTIPGSSDVQHRVGPAAIYGGGTRSLEPDATRAA